MHSFFLKLNKYKFYILIPIVLFLSFSLAFMIRSGVIFFLPQVNAQKSVRSSALAIPTSQPKAVNLYENTVMGNLIRGSVPGAEPETGQGKDGTTNVSLTEEVPGADDLLVTGTLSGNTNFARVTIRAKGKEEADEFKIGQKVAGYEVKAIYNHYVVLFKNGIHLRVEIEETIGEAKKRIAAKEKSPEEVAGKPNPDGCPVTKKIISRTDFERTLKNPADIYKDARFGPNLVEGKGIDGYKLSVVPSNHIFYALGARNGDIVKRVNGLPLVDTEKMLELWSSIKNAVKIVVDIDRKGKCLSYEFAIRN
jgi:general secretion pathway protein C